MGNPDLRYTRREFLAATAAAAGAAALPLAPAQARSKYTRHNVTSSAGQRMLASYAKGVEAMLRLPADHPQNWFRNAFIHLMDCPHGNWWFYVWHRGYLGHFERTIRQLSGDSAFALPYWDWTQLPQIPGGMFDGVLTPVAQAFEPYTGNLALFTAFLKPALTAYWNGLSSAQKAQLSARGYKVFDDLWNDVTGYDASVKAGVAGNAGFAVTCCARYLSRDNPRLDDKTAYNVSEFVVYSGLLPADFYNPVSYLSFASSRTPSHNTPPGGATSFSTLEGLPHNKVHNYIGGVGPLDPGPYGSMTNFLSPVDPIFFLHHSNMDRLWDVWTRKQMRRGLPFLPSGQDLKALSDEPFLFFVDGHGRHVASSTAGDYLSAELFGYDYEPGFGEAIVEQPPDAVRALKAPPIHSSIKDNAASVVVPRSAIQSHLAETFPQPLLAQVTLARPGGISTTREFDVLVDAPAGVVQVAADSPHYAGTIAFFGPSMSGMKMSHDATFVVPLPKALRAFTGLGVANSATLNIRVVPAHGTDEPAPALKGVSVGAG